MWEFLTHLLDTTDFPARWYCGNWSDAHGWLHICSDLAIWGAYMTIPIVLAYFVMRRSDIVFPRIFWLFALFILSCGLVHLVESLIFWWPVYRLSGLVKVVTALASWGTVVALVPVVPKALRMKSPEALQAEIVERERAERQLRASVERMRQIIDTAHDAYLAMDAQGRIIDWNPRAEEILGWSRREAVGRLVSETIVPERMRPEHKRGLAHYLETGEGPVLNRRIELTALHRDGREFPIELTITALKQGEETIFNAFLHDISQRKQAEEALRAAKDAAEAASRAKSAFLANMSHEIRTPMNAIIGMTELLLGTDLTPQQREYLTLVEESGESLLLVIDDILDFSKIEARRLDLHPEQFDIRERLGDVMKALAIRAHEKGLELAFHIDPQTPELLLGDHYRLRQIVSNLVGNAIKFTSQGEVVLNVEPQEQKGDNVVLHFTVRDTGPGIPPDKHQAIFEAFEQADSTATRRFGGTGLGLAICARLVALMGGTIWVESTPGQGSTFHFTVCLRRSTAESWGSAAWEPAQLRGLGVLVVDDSATNRRILVEMLTNWTMEPTAVDGAEAALAELARAGQSGQPYHLVITDENMPGGDGFALAQAIREDTQFQGTLIMMLSSSEQPADATRCEQLGIRACLMKPVKQSELLDAIMLALDMTMDEVPAALPPADQTAQRPLRILLVEDSLVNQKVAVGMLGRMGHHVTVASNGRQAVAALQTQPFDLVLMDVQMPEMDGLEATARIRAAETQTGDHVPIVAMTAHALKGDRERCLRAGMDAYLAKPIRSGALAAVIGRLFGGNHGHGASGDVPKLRETETGNMEIDWNAVLERLENDRALLGQVVDAFLEQTPSLMEKLRQAVAQHDAPAVRWAAHTLKGSVRYFGDCPAADLALRLEMIGRDGQWGQEREILSELEKQIDEIMEALRAMPPELRSQA